MISCCRCCYQKYLNMDGSINYEEYIKLLEKLKKENKEFSNPEKLCKCSCHKIGLNVRH